MKALEYLEERKSAPGDVIGILEDGTIVRQAGVKPTARGIEGKSLTCTDACSLIEQTFPPLSEPVKGLIVEGATLLAGASKIGKSWLVLSMACAVAAGKPFLGRATLQGDVLYLALEDSLRRLQARLKTLHEEPSEALTFATECTSIDDDLISELREWVRSRKRPRMIIIDTLQKVRGGVIPARANAYAADYAMMGTLKAFADEHHIALVLVHHLNKMKDVTDPYDRISGSTGLMGAADTTVMITRERGSEDAKVTFTGRDVWGDDFMIRMQEGRWTALSEATRAAELYAASPIVQTCRELLAQSFGKGGVSMSKEDFKDACVRLTGVLPWSSSREAVSRLEAIAPELLKNDGIVLQPNAKVGTKRGIRLSRAGLSMEGKAYGE